MNPLLFGVLPEIILSQLPVHPEREDDSSGGAAVTASMSDVRDVRTEAHALRFDLERVLMITEALWEILKKEHGYTDETLVDLVSQIDLKDGRLDGKVAKSAPRPCASCQRTLVRHQSKCLYCGHPVQSSPFER